MIDEAMIAAVGETLRSRWIASGPQVQAFEAALSALLRGAGPGAPRRVSVAAAFSS